MTTRQIPDVQPLLDSRFWVSIGEAAILTRLSRASICKAIADGDLIVGKVGRVSHIRLDDLKRFCRRWKARALKRTRRRLQKKPA